MRPALAPRPCIDYQSAKGVIKKNKLPKKQPKKEKKTPNQGRKGEKQPMGEDGGGGGLPIMYLPSCHLGKYMIGSPRGGCASDMAAGARGVDAASLCQTKRQSRLHQNAFLIYDVLPYRSANRGSREGGCGSGKSMLFPVLTAQDLETFISALPRVLDDPGFRALARVGRARPSAPYILSGPLSQAVEVYGKYPGGGQHQRDGATVAPHKLRSHRYPSSPGKIPPLKTSRIFLN